MLEDNQGAATVIVAGAYWGLHDTFCDYAASNPAEALPSGELFAHLPNAEHPHPAPSETTSDFP